MRVLLVQSPSGTKEELVFPLGLCYIATALKNKNHEVRTFDTNVSAAPEAELKKTIRNLEPEIIGVGLRNIDSATYWNYHSYFEPFLDLTLMLKKAAPYAKILAGGAGFSLYAEQLLKRAKAIDYGIFQEGEESMPELLDNIEQPQSVRGVFYRRNDTIHFTGAREHIDFSKLPAPQRDIINLTPYIKHPFSIGVQTKRGCIFKCAYCTYPYLGERKVRLRPVHAVLDELEGMVKEYGIKNFWFVDSIFNVPLTYAREICEGMLARGLNLRWLSWQNEKPVDREYMKLAKDAGCDCFCFSLDGMSNSTLTALKKNTTKQDIENIYSLAKQIDNTKFSFSFFANGPGESLVNLFNIFRFISRLKLRLRGRASAMVCYIRIYPHTSICNLAIEKGLIKKDDDLLKPAFYRPLPWRYVLNILFFFINIALKMKRMLVKVMHYFKKRA